MHSEMMEKQMERSSFCAYSCVFLLPAPLLFLAFFAVHLDKMAFMTYLVAKTVVYCLRVQLYLVCSYII